MTAELCSPVVLARKKISWYGIDSTTYWNRAVEDPNTVFVVNSHCETLLDSLEAMNAAWLQVPHLQSGPRNLIQQIAFVWEPQAATNVHGVLVYHSTVFDLLVEHSHGLLADAHRETLLVDRFAVWGRELEVARYLFQGMKDGLSTLQNSKVLTAQNLEAIEAFYDALVEACVCRDSIKNILPPEDNYSAFRFLKPSSTSDRALRSLDLRIPAHFTAVQKSYVLAMAKKEWTLAHIGIDNDYVNLYVLPKLTSAIWQTADQLNETEQSEAATFFETVRSDFAKPANNKQ